MFVGFCLSDVWAQLPSTARRRTVSSRLCDGLVVPLLLSVLCFGGFALSQRWHAVIVFGRGTGCDQIDDLLNRDGGEGRPDE